MSEFQIDRQDFQDKLELLKPGINPKENVPQSAYYVVSDGFIRTFNDHVACSFPVDLDFTGAIHWQKLLPTISKFPDEVVTLSVDDQDRLVIKGRGRRSRISMQTEILMEIDAIEQPVEENWVEIPPGFTEALPMLSECYLKGSQLENHLATCVNLNFEKGIMLANDGRQACRVEIDALKQIDSPEACVAGESLKPLRNVIPTAIQVSENWLHFTNHDEMVYSIRLYDDTFPDMDDMFDVKGTKIIFPSNVDQVIDRAKVHSSDNVDDPSVTVRLGEGVFQIVASGISSDYIEKKKSTYQGETFEFQVDPEVLANIAKHKAAIRSSDSPILLVKGQGWSYITLVKE